MTYKQLQAENERLRRALRVIHTWADFAVDDDVKIYHLEKIAEKAEDVLKGDNR